MTEVNGGNDILYTVNYDVFKDGEFVGSVSPAVQLVQSTQQQKLVAGVISFPTEDLFVVYRGVNDEGDFSMDVRVNPLISFVWVGFALLMVGCLIPLFAKRAERRRGGPAVGDVPAAELAEAEPKECGKASRDAAPRKSVVEETVAVEVALVEDAEGDAAADADAAAVAEASGDTADADADAANAGAKAGE